MTGPAARPERIVDAHVHLSRLEQGHDEVLGAIKRAPAAAEVAALAHDVDAWLERMDHEGIWQTWLIHYDAPLTMGYGRDAYAWVPDFVAAAPERLVGVGGFEPRAGAGDGASAIDALLDGGLRALKIHPVHQHLDPGSHRNGTEAGARLQAAYGRAEELRLPTIFHTGSSVFPRAENSFAGPAALAPVLEDFPDLPVILAHGGRPHATRDAVALLERFPNAYLELSGCPPQRLHDYFGDLAPWADRTTWGTDWPGPKVPGMGANVEAFLALGYPAEVNQKILHDTSQRLLAGIRG
ncbi:MAG: amidohydrolase family protein [Thermoplasmatota archaeon]